VNDDRVRLYANWMDYGLGLDSLRQIPGRLTAVVPEMKNCFIVTTVKDNFSLWLHYGREESLRDQLAVREYCLRRGFEGFLATVPLKTGLIYSQVGERGWFYLARWACFERVSYRNSKHLQAIVRLIATFQKSVAGMMIPAKTQNKEGSILPEKIQESGHYLAGFKMLAAHRLRPTRFDRLFLGIAPRLETMAAKSLKLLESSRYRELFAALQPDNLVINDFSRGNLRVDSIGKVRLLRLKNYRFDLPVMDLAVLLLKSGRSQHWERSWYEALLAEYQNYAPLTMAEIAIIKAYLYFPWNIYHLASRYYLNRVTWPNYLFNEKLERLIADEENRVRLITEI
jgi:CotS family spore coat protein